MAIVGVVGDVAVEGRKGRGYYGHGTKERVDAVLVITVAVTGESGRLKSATCQTCPIVAALQLFLEVSPGEGEEALCRASKPRRLLREKLG